MRTPASPARSRPALLAAVASDVLGRRLSEDDRVVPFGPTTLAGSVPQIRTLRGGHFVPFCADGFATTTAAQAEFFARELASRSSVGMIKAIAHEMRTFRA